MADLRRLAPLGLPLAAILFLIGGPILGATPDDEEYRSAIISVVLHARALLDGVYPYWTSSLAFGLPHPLHPALLLHPLMPIFGVLAPDTAARILYVAHAALGVAGCWWLVRHLGGGPWAAGLAGCTWALSTPSQNYVLTDFWPVEFVVWSLAPYLLLLAIRVLDAPVRGRPWVDAMAFGLVAGLMWANGHAGYVPVFFLPLAIMFAAHWRRVGRCWAGFALAVCVGLAVAGPTLAHLLAEFARFPTLPRLTSRTVIGWQQLIDMVLRPLSFDSPAQMMTTILRDGARVPFFGGPLFLLALATAGGIAGGFSYRRGLTLAFVSSFVLMLMTGLERGGVLSGAFLFRDPMVLFGIVLGSLAWQVLASRSPRAAWTAAVLQVAVLFVAAWPFVNRTLAGREITDPILHNTSTAAALGNWSARVSGRWYVAPELETLVLGHRLFRDGLWLNMWLYSGLPVVNGVFKGVSVNEIYPSEYVPIGRILGHRSTVGSPSTLDVLGIGTVLATATEPVAPTLTEVTRVPSRDHGDLRLMRNPSAWPGAAFVDERAIRIELSPLAGCTIGGVLCLDFAPVASAADHFGVHLDRRHGDIAIHFRRDSVAARWLVVSEMYRPGWQARASGLDLPVTRVLDGLIGVRVPAGTADIELRYRPTLLIVLTWVSGATLFLALLILLVVFVNRGHPARYLNLMLARYVGYHLPVDARVVEFAPRSPLLAGALARGPLPTAFPVTASGPSEAVALNSWDELRAFQPDRIILNGSLHYEPDIQALFEQLRSVCAPDTRLIVAYYSSLWRPVLTLGSHFGLSTKRPDHNWVTPSDVANLLRLTGFEMITESQHLLVPIGIPVVSGFVNRWLAPLPVARWFTLVNLALVRIVPSETTEPLSVSVIVPARNERGNISGIVERIPRMGPADEIVFVEGHSSDGTWEAIQEIVARHPDRRIRAFQQSGRGKGDAVRTGFAAATGDLLMILDADLTVAPEDLPKFYRALTSGRGEFINGSRLIYPMEREAMRFANMVGNKFFALAFSYLLGQPLKDTLCGTKALSRRHYDEIARGRMYFGNFDPFGDFDLLFGAAKLGLRIVELPVRYRERTYGSTNIRRWVHGWLLLRMTAFAARKMKFI
jgi:hypothetical protein